MEQGLAWLAGAGLGTAGWITAWHGWLDHGLTRLYGINSAGFGLAVLGSAQLGSLSISVDAYCSCTMSWSGGRPGVVMEL
ncbi:hypothetical protein Pmani_005445 [Petrolisthes manimaculis]|uniref:Uncharacterized protein n=1 Tax=Petrolisthes manimaculis TaxID=1843537 RepID=A0AAE1QCN3_9EUCA|nr:hypothetical protein Pmani_005445 [Petrolisthes manimaculis]